MNVVGLGLTRLPAKSLAPIAVAAIVLPAATLGSIVKTIYPLLMLVLSTATTAEVPSEYLNVQLPAEANGSEKLTWYVDAFNC
ncbi:hypothetical protein HPT25_07335 [Bacillus sp. BRMEA1]|uniref:hypothetical protein n=1 Tax=Neobacillus endophyticus TaxID=2738405 RepID=UPI0015675C98|nr:hypothetical protein [Neobacillus endophyticus]NRD77310.1 hypothetical protein [Neobacillus endophyticus]